MLLRMGSTAALAWSSLLLASSALLLATCKEAPTWESDVAPIVATKCASCHRDGGAAFALSSYADARSHGVSIDHLVSTRQMPPWPPEQTDGCPSLIGDRHLSAADIELVNQWVEGGMPKGVATGIPLAEPAPFGELEGISAELGPDEAYQPPTDGDDYRCYLMDANLSKDAFITAYRMNAGAGVHHVQLWELEDDDGTKQIAKADAEAPGPGFPCTVWPGAAVRVLTVWGPSDPVRRHPRGTGVRVRAGKKLVLQVHYHHASGPSRPSIGLALAGSVPEEASLLDRKSVV